MFSRFIVPLSSQSRQLRSADPFVDLHREITRLFDDFVPSAGTGSGGSSSGMITAPRLDVREGEQELCVCAEMPGVEQSDVDLRLDGDLLTIQGEKKSDTEQKNDNYHVMERSFGRFQRSLQLPFAPEPDQVKAEFRNGVLTIRIPKQAQQDRSKRIEIQAGGGEQRPQAQRVGGPDGTGQGQGIH